MEKKINIQLPENFDPSKPIIILEGDAQKPHYREPMSHRGELAMPDKWVQSMNANGIKIDGTNARCVVDYNEMSINLIVSDDENRTEHKFTGKTAIFGYLAELGINTTKQFQPMELGQFIRRHLFLFADQKEGMNLSTQLMKFKAKIESLFNASNDNRGNTEKSIQTIFESDLPHGFTLRTPLFVDTDVKIDIPVEIFINPTSSGVSIYLESYQLRVEIIEQIRSRIEQCLKTIDANNIPIIRMY